MASWLKAAEDLFEVVDRRAKLVISELSDEQKQSNATASNGPASKSKRAKQRKKAVRHLASETGSDSGPTKEPANSQDPQPDVESDRSLLAGSIKNEEGPAIEAVPNVNEDFVPSTHPAEVPTTGEPHSVNSEQNHELQEAGVLTAADQEKSVPIETEVSISTGSSTRETDQKVEPLDKRKIVTDDKENIPSVKLHGQHDEAQGLLKNTVSTGQSKEAENTAGSSYSVQFASSSGKSTGKRKAIVDDFPDGKCKMLVDTMEELSRSIVKFTEIIANKVVHPHPNSADLFAAVIALDLPLEFRLQSYEYLSANDAAANMFLGATEQYRAPILTRIMQNR